MNKLTILLVLVACAAFAGEPPNKANNSVPVQNKSYMATAPVANSRATFYNSTGQKTGSAQTSPQGVTTFRDTSSRVTGRAQQVSSGVVFSDSVNRTQGKATVTK